jgi:hypothetical protein
MSEDLNQIYCGRSLDMNPNKLFLNSSLGRVWIIYSLLDAKTSDHIITKWIENKKGLDNCWLSRKHLLYWEKRILEAQRLWI